MSEKSEKKMAILVLQRSWVVAGEVERVGEDVFVREAVVVRSWGTTGKGIGHLGIQGPQQETVLDVCPDVQTHELTIVMQIGVEDRAVAAWKHAIEKLYRQARADTSTNAPRADTPTS